MRQKFKVGDIVILNRNSKRFLNLKNGVEGVVVSTKYMWLTEHTSYRVLFNGHRYDLPMWSYELNLKKFK